MTYLTVKCASSKRGVSDSDADLTALERTVRSLGFKGECLQQVLGALEEDRAGYAEILELAVAERTRELQAENALLQAELYDAKRLTDSLREAEKRFGLIMESIDELVWLSDAELQHMLYVSPAYERIWNRPRQQLDHEPRSFLDAVHPEDHDRIMAAALACPGHIFNEEYRIIRPDGTTRWIWARTYPLHGETGKVTHFAGTATDITERKTAEAALHNEEKRCRMLFEIAPTPMLILYYHDRSCALNRKAAEVLGYTSEDFVTTDTLTRMIPDEDHRTKILDECCPRDPQEHQLAAPLSFETEVVCKDGRVKLMEIRIANSCSCSLICFSDLSGHLAVQDQLLRTQKLESLGVLAGGIAHDFNNILTSVMGNISLAAMSLSATHPSSRLLADAEKATRRAAELASRLITFARGGNPIKKIIQIRPLLEEAVTLVLSGANVRAETDFASDLGLINVDPGQIEQVFSNILINALQAMPDGGRLTLKAKVVTIRTRQNIQLRPGPYVRITFVDEGVGISKQDLKKIFDPYFTTKPKGKGLGLSTVYSIVTKHGGSVEVESAVGMGTTFTVYLPSVAGEEEAPAEAEGTVEAAGPGGRVLVMDDEKIICNLAVTILSRRGFHVETCNSGEEAVEAYSTALAKGTPFAAVIMDLTIPGGMGGKEAAEQIRSLHPHANLIVSSGYSNDPVMANYGAFGFCAALHKPYKATDILNVLHKALNVNTHPLNLGVEQH